MREKVGFRDIVGYAFGGTTYMIELTIMLSYLTLFCTDVMQMDITILGIVIAATKILDAVTDIFVTNLADKTQTKFGKYRVWLLMAIPLGCFLFLSYLYPSFLKTQTQKTLWICLLYVLTVPVFETAYCAPLMVLNTTITDDYRERTNLALARAIGEACGMLIVTYACMRIILSFGTYKDIAGWRVMALVMGGLVILCGLIAFFSIKERVKVSNQTSQGDQLLLKDKLALLKHNPPFVKVIILVVAFMINYYGCMSMFPYFCIYVLGHEEWYATLMSLSNFTQLPFIILLIFVSQKVEKRMIMAVGGMCLAVGAALLFGMKSFGAAVVFQILFGIGNACINGLLFSLMPDLCDYTEYKKDVAAPGIFAAISTFCMKVSGAGATLFLTRILDSFQYDGTLFQQAESTVRAIRFSFGGISLVTAVVTIIAALSVVELSRKQVAFYRQEIDRRRTEPSV